MNWGSSVQVVISNRTLAVQLALENHALAAALGIFDGGGFFQSQKKFNKRQKIPCSCNGSSPIIEEEAPRWSSTSIKELTTHET